MPHLLRSASRLAVVIALIVATAAAQAREAQTFFFLDISGRVLRAKTDGADMAVVAQELGMGPDGIALDMKARHMYWTSMGRASVDDGTVTRIDFDGKNLTTIIPAGGTFTPKQLKIDTTHRKLYWSDREGMRVMRATLDGSQIETLLVTGSGDTDRKDQSKWCVGIALDTRRNRMFYTSLQGEVGVAKLNGQDARLLLTKQGTLTGIALTE